LPEINPNASEEDKYLDANHREALDEHLENNNTPN